MTALDRLRSLIADYEAQDPLRREPCRMVAVDALREVLDALDELRAANDASHTILQAALPYDIAPWSDLSEAAQICVRVLREQQADLACQSDQIVRLAAELKAKDAQAPRAPGGGAGARTRGPGALGGAHSYRSGSGRTG